MLLKSFNRLFVCFCLFVAVITIEPPTNIAIKLCFLMRIIFCMSKKNKFRKYIFGMLTDFSHIFKE